jgi:hypothetical protein
MKREEAEAIYDLGKEAVVEILLKRVALHKGINPATET